MKNALKFKMSNKFLFHYSFFFYIICPVLKFKYYTYVLTACRIKNNVSHFVNKTVHNHA